MSRVPPPHRAAAYDPYEDDPGAIPEADRALFAQRVLGLYAAGKSVAVIAFEEGCDHTIVHTLIREQTAEIRQNNRQIMEERFLQQDLGIQKLIAKCMEELTLKFSTDVVRTLVTLYERQAKLWAVDRPSASGETRGRDWAMTAPEDELLRRAKAMGIRLPEKITGLA